MNERKKVLVIEDDVETAKYHAQRLYLFGFDCDLAYDGRTALDMLRTNEYELALVELMVDEVISKQHFKAHTAELLEGGDYKLVIRSRAGDAAGPLQTATKRVKYLKVADLPTVDSIATEGRAGIVKGEAFAAIGGNLSWKDGDSIKVKWSEGSEEKSLDLTPKATTPEKMDFDAVNAFEDIPDDTELTFEFTLGGADAEAETRLLAPEPIAQTPESASWPRRLAIRSQSGSISRSRSSSRSDETACLRFAAPCSGRGGHSRKVRR